MTCPHCPARPILKRLGTTDWGYSAFRCPACRRKCNEGTSTLFHPLEFPTDIVFPVVLCRLRYKLNLRDLAELFLLRGFPFMHEAKLEFSVYPSRSTAAVPETGRRFVCR
jgi:putative transposase